MCLANRVGLAVFFLIGSLSQVHAQSVPSVYDGTISITVDATDVQHRVFNVKERLPVKPGPLTLWLPQWIPGNHSPTGGIVQLAGLVISAKGKRIEWKRDPVDMFAFNLEVPSGVKEIDLSYQSLTPSEPSQGRVVMTPTMFNLQWIALAIYPAGYDDDKIMFKPSLKVPNGWKPFCALELESQSGDLYNYKAISFHDFVDSPVFAGKYYKTFDLDPGAKIPVRLNVVADDPRFLEPKDDHIAAHRNLIRQFYKLFNSQHYDHYDFLLALSKQLSGIGLEHHRSSENALSTGYFKDWDPKAGSSDLLGHEFSHSWNGKFRRPADLARPNFNVPSQNSLLWVYEGQTQYWGEVLTARAGLRTAENARDDLAMNAANYAENRPGLSWRALQDTTNDPIISYRGARPYTSWQLARDYYPGAELLWLEADVHMRAKSGGVKSLDDFARAFFSIDDGSWKISTYTFEDVVKTLNEIVPEDWATFLKTRLDGHGSLTGGIEAAGWRLVFKDTPNAAAKNAAKEDRGNDYTYSLGFSVNSEGKFNDVRWDGPAFRAGIGVGMTLTAVNDRQYSKDYLDDAIKAAQKGDSRIRFMVKDFDVYRSITIDYKGGLRYPHLERIEGKPDYLTLILSPR